ncbi:hypothetical protein like AT1G07985 [Hibiscus trionum]|uniref:Uncharacterized protein n=1 Tax=Hibiscus trionum TaxID=183268 RepID=A0A9W7HBE7_HIBTR|nr:hypothetical protein like AT1G07985 [Hibiscus trionum]
MGIIGEEPVLSRLDRLDNMLRQLEEMRGSNYNRTPSPRSSSASTPSSGTLTSTCTGDFSPTVKTLEKYCCPMDHVIVETRVKGMLIQRLNRAEDRLLKVCTYNLVQLMHSCIKVNSMHSCIRS